MRHATPVSAPEQRAPFNLDQALGRLRGRGPMLI
jgi:hypothetical protein